jgi:hypothetical protein
MAIQPTCGQGLAEHATLPARLGELIDAVVMASARVVAACETFVRLEEELLALLQQRLEQERRMLVTMVEAVHR